MNVKTEPSLVLARMIPSADDPPLIGRNGELDVLRETIARAHGGQPGVVLLDGEGGTGKSRLYQEARTYACRIGATVLDARAIPGAAGTMYATLQAGLRHSWTHTDADREAVLDASSALQSASWLNDSRHDAGPLKAFTRLLDASQRLVVLMVDDAHHSDSHSSRLIGALIAQMATERFAVVAAGLSDGRCSGVLELLSNSAGPERVRRLRLSALESDDACELARAVAGPSANEACVEQLAERSEGNPLLLCTLGTHLRQDGVLADALPDQVVHRLLPVGPQVEELARGLSVAGRLHLCRLPALLAALSLDERAGEDAFDQLVRAGRLAAVEDGGFVLAPPILRESVYQSLGVAERHRLHRALVIHLTSLQRTGEPIDVREVAHHAAAGALGVDAEAAVLAAEAGDAELAESPSAATDWYERALALCPAAHRARPSYGARLAVALLRSGAAGEAALRGQEALQLLPAGDERTGAVATVAEALLARARPQAAMELLKTEELSGPLDPLLLALRAASSIALGNQVGAARDLVAARQFLFSERISPDTAVVVHTYAAYLASAKGDVTGMRASLADVVAVSGGAPQYRQEWAFGFGAFMFAAGRMPDDAELLLQRARQLRSAQAGATSWTNLAEVMVHACRGDWARLLADGPQLAQALTSADDASGLTILGTLMSMTGWVSGSPDAPSALPNPLVPDAAYRPGIRGEALALYLLLRSGIPTEAREGAFDEGPRSEPGWLSALVAPYLPLLQRGIGNSTQDERQSSGDDFAHLVMLLAAAEGESDIAAALSAVVLAESLGLPFYIAEAKLAAGELGARPAEYLTEAWRIFDGIGAECYRQRAASVLRDKGLPVPRKRRLSPGMLTQSEWQVVELVSRGLRNRDIARQLSYSVRTVETYITRVYQKTGINSRIGLVQAIASGSLPSPDQESWL